MDIADNADKQVEDFQRYSAMTKKPEGPAPTGACLYCDEALALPKRWCDSDCRDAFEKQLRRNYGAN